MKIININPENQHHYFCCLEEYSCDILEAGDYKRRWYEQMKNKGLRVKYAVDDNGVIGGMIHYLPIEHSMFKGENLYVVLCIWVHGHKQGRGNFQNKGMGKALLTAAEEDCRNIGTNGLVTWGMWLPFFMRSSWFKKQGYKVIGKDGIMRLLWKPFKENAIAPQIIKPIKTPQKKDDILDISIFRNGWCPAQNMVYERAKRAAAELPNKIEIKEYDTTDKSVFSEWGISDALFIDGKAINTGPPPSYDKIKRIIRRRVKD